MAFDRGANSAKASLTGPAGGIVAAIAARARQIARTVIATDRAIVANVLAAETGLTAHIAGAGIGRAIFEPAAAAISPGNTAIAPGAAPTATLAFGAAEIVGGAWAKPIGRAAQVFSVAISGTTVAAAAFGIVGVRGIEMRMATMIATDLAPIELRFVGGNRAAAISGGALTGADRILAACLGRRIEATAIGVDQRFDTDASGLGGLGWFRSRGARDGRLSRLLKWGGGVGGASGDRRGQRSIGQPTTHH